MTCLVPDLWFVAYEITKALYEAMGHRFQFGIAGRLPPGLIIDESSIVQCLSSEPDEEGCMSFGMKLWAYRG